MLEDVGLERDSVGMLLVLKLGGSGSQPEMNFPLGMSGDVWRDAAKHLVHKKAASKNRLKLSQRSGEQVRKPVLDQPFSNLTWSTNVYESTRILLQKQNLSDSPRVAQSCCIFDKLSLVIYVQVPARVPLFG